MRRKRAFMTLVGLAAGATLALAASSLAGAQQASPSDLSGKWELVPEQSDDGKSAADALLPRFGGPEDEAGPGQAMAPPEIPSGGAPGPTGLGGRRSGVRDGLDGGGPRGAGRFRPPSPAEREAVEKAVRQSLVATPLFRIEQVENEIVFRYPDGGIRALISDGKKHEDLGVACKARWKDAHLIVETETRPVKIEETYAIDPATALLIVEVRADHRRRRGEVTVKRVYRKVTAAPSVP